MDERPDFDKFVDGIAEHLKANCQGLGVMVLVHAPGGTNGIEMWVNTADPLFSNGLLRLATIAVEESTRAQSIKQTRISTVSNIAEDVAKEKQRMN